jgi:hypothetical protein
MEEFLDEMQDTRHSPDRAQGIVRFELEQFFEHGPVRKIDEQGMIVRAVLFGESGQLFVYLMGQVLRGQFMRTKDEQPFDIAAGGDAHRGTVAGIGQKDIVPEGSFIGNEGLGMSQQQLFLDFHHIERDDKPGRARLAVEFQIGVQFEIHDRIGQMGVDILGKDSSSA